MQVLAILTVRNEIRFIDSCLRHLTSNGVETHVIDNGSTDGTIEVAEAWLGRGVAKLDHQPWSGAFELREQLRLKEGVALASNADWFIHMDADERRDAPLPYKTLQDAIVDVDRRGYNSIDFDEFVFVPTAENPSFDTPDFEDHMRWYYHYEPTSPDRFRVNAWKRTPLLDLVSQGGHHVHFPGLRVFPRPFIMRHYPVLSSGHAEEKYGHRIFSATELADSWHSDRKGFRAEALSFPARHRLHELPIDSAKRRSFNPSSPWDKHPFLDRAAGPINVRAAPDPERPTRLSRLQSYAHEHSAHIPSFASPSAVQSEQTSNGAMWSVMLPVWNPQIEQLREALQSVLDQDPGADLMQVGVVDDASANSDAIERLVHELGDGRISYRRNPVGLGLAGNWNEAVRQSNARLVHLLHQDDRVLPGFYDALGRPLANDPSLVGAFCRVSGFNELGEVTWTPLAEQAGPGPLAGLDIAEAQHHRMIVTGVVVRRSSYEQLGGYRTDMPYCTDWDFLKRLAVLGPVWYEPAVLAHWRQHSHQESARLAATGADMADRQRSVELSMSFLSAETRSLVRFGAYQSSLSYGVETLRAHINSGAIESARAQAIEILATLEHLDSNDGREITVRSVNRLDTTPLRNVRAADSTTPSTTSRGLLTARRRIETLEAQIQGWICAVRAAQRREEDGT